MLLITHWYKYYGEGTTKRNVLALASTLSNKKIPGIISKAKTKVGTTNRM